MRNSRPRTGEAADDHAAATRALVDASRRFREQQASVGAVGAGWTVAASSAPATATDGSSSGPGHGTRTLAAGAGEGATTSFPELVGAPRAAGRTDMALPGTLDPAVAALGDDASSTGGGGTTSAAQSVEAARREILRRHGELQKRRSAQLDRARALARTLAAADAAGAGAGDRALLPEASEGARYADVLRSREAEEKKQKAMVFKRVDVPMHQKWGVVTVCNRRRPPLLTEPAFILEGAFSELSQARRFMERAVRTPGYVGAPMVIKMRDHEFLAVSRDRQVNAELKRAKVDRLLGRHYLDMDLKQREHAQNLLQRKAGRVGLSRNFLDMRKKAERDKKKELALRKFMRDQAKRRARLMEETRERNDQLALLADSEDKQEQEAAAVLDAELRAVEEAAKTAGGGRSGADAATADVDAAAPARPVHATTADCTPASEGDSLDAQAESVPSLEELDSEEDRKRLEELRRLGGRHSVEFSFPQELKTEGQAYAVISIVPDTDTARDEKDTAYRADAPGNEPLLIWYGAFPDEESADQCVKCTLSEYGDLGVADRVPMYVPLRPNSVDLDEVEEHYKDKEQQAVAAFKKSQRHARAKFDELCEGVDVPIVDLAHIDLSPAEVETAWRVRCALARDAGEALPPLPRPLVEHYAAVFRDGGAVPADVRAQLVANNVEKSAGEQSAEAYEQAKREAETAMQKTDALK